MKILQLISSTGYFGAENVLVQLATVLHRNEDCHVISGVIKNLATPHVEVIDQSRKKGIETVIFPCKGKCDHSTILHLRRFIQEEGVDLVHSHGYKSNLYSFFATFGLPTKLVATCHNWLGDNPKMKFYAILDRFFLKRFSSVVAVSLPVKEKILQGNVAEEKVRIIKNGIDLSRFDVQSDSSALKKSLGIPEKHLVIGTVGRISSEKGHVHLLNVVQSLQKRLPEMTLLLVGDGDLREKLENKFQRASVIFTGTRSDLPELYHCMDIFVLPSLTEGLPMVLLEAMASSLPVVATRVGDVPMVVVEQETGFLVNPGDEASLEQYILSLVDDSRKRKSMGRKGCQRVKEGFSSSQMAHDYLQVYHDVLAS